MRYPPARSGAMEPTDPMRASVAAPPSPKYVLQTPGVPATIDTAVSLARTRRTAQAYRSTKSAPPDPSGNTAPGPEIRAKVPGPPVPKYPDAGTPPATVTMTPLAWICRWADSHRVVAGKTMDLWSKSIACLADEMRGISLVGYVIAPSSCSGSAHMT